MKTLNHITSALLLHGKPITNKRIYIYGFLKNHTFYFRINCSTAECDDERFGWEVEKVLSKFWSR